MNASAVFSVIIPVYNNWSLTAACLRSLRENTPEYAYEVIIADNGSTDDTARELPDLGRTLFGERFHHIRFEENRNFGPACNAGAARATAPLFFFLNNDTLLTQGWAPPLVRALHDDSRLGAAGPLLLYEDDTVQHLGVAFDVSGVEHLYRSFPRTHPMVTKRRHLQALTGAALMVPADIFHKHGGFHEGYENGFEDIDLCLHIHATGKKLSCIAESVIYHLESRTPGRKAGDADNARLLFQRCGHLYAPDKHVLGLKDGFEPFINDMYSIGLGLQQKGAEALGREAADGSPEAWYALTRANPFWVEGREYLADLFERRGQKKDALFFLMEIAMLEKRVAPCARFLKAAALAREPDMLRFAEDLYGELDVKRTKKAQVTAALRTIMKRKDSFLGSLYMGVLQEYFS